MKFVVFFLLYGIPNVLLAKDNMRRCLLLPITAINQQIKFQIFESIEEYLKDSDWCYYRSNSKIIDILGKYKDLRSHLRNENVLEILANKTKSGSLIRINIVGEVEGFEVSMSVIGKNGKDIYFHKKTKFKKETFIIQTIKNWLTDYKKMIPYTAQITGVLGDRFSIDSGKDVGIHAGGKVSVKRYVKKNIHPLTRKIVEWETSPVGEGKIIRTEQSKAEGEITFYKGKKNLKIGDWIIFKPSNSFKEIKVHEKTRPDKLGTIGEFKFFLEMGDGQAIIENNEITKISGLTVGVLLDTEIWFTRSFWTSFEIGRKTGSYSQDVGTASSNSISNNRAKWKIGYRYLPMGFFNGPRINIYTGYAKYRHKFTRSDGFVGNSFDGILIGAKGELPFYKLFKFSLMLDFIFDSSYEDDENFYSGAESVSSYNMEFAGRYNYSRNIQIEGSFSVLSNSLNYSNDSSTSGNLTFKEVFFRTGMVLSF